MASDEERLIVSLEARITQFEKAFAKATGTSNSAWNAIEARGKRGAANLESSLARATHGVNEHLLGMAREGAAALTAALGVEKLREMSDEWTLFRGRIAASGVAAEQINAKLRELSDIAIRSHATLEQVGTVYTALRRAAAELGASEAQTVRATETLQKALTLGGQGQQDTQAAILEISHALAGGRINGVELNKLLMEAPTLVKAIAKEFGVSTGQLRALKEEGQELSADKVFGGILHGAKDIDEAFAKLRPTISQSMQMLNTSMTRYVGEADQANGFTRALSSGIMELGENINVVAPIAFTLSAGLLGLFVGGPIVGGIAAATAGIIALGTTIRPIHGELATLADYARVAFRLIEEKGGEAARYLEEKFANVASSLSAAMSGLGISFTPLLDAVKTLVNATIGAFAFAAQSIIISWQSIIPELAEVTTNAVNGVIAGIEGMINKVTGAINSLIEGLNRISHTNFSPMGTVDLGRITDGSQGAAERTAKAFGEAFKNSFKDYVGDALNAGADALKSFHDRANRLANSEAGPASKPLGDEGSLDQPLKSSPDPKKIKDYNEIINKTKEFVQNQELERRELTESAEAASALKHEQDLLNEASAKEIRLTAEQRTQIKGLAEDMAHAEQATKHLADMKEAIESLGQTITDDLVSALDGLISRSRTWEQSLASLGRTLAKMAIDAALWGKGPLAELTGQKDNGILSQAVRSMLPKSNAQPQQFLPTPAIPINAGTVNVTAGTVNSGASGAQGTTSPLAPVGKVTQSPLPPVGAPQSSAPVNISSKTPPVGGSARWASGFTPSATADGYDQPHSASADMMGLKPGWRATVEQLQKDAAAQGIQTKAVSGYRDTDLQAKLYANYQAKKAGQPLPYPESGSGGMAAAPGHSYHNYGEAADIIATDPSKQAALTALARQPQRGIKVGADFGDYDHYEQGTYPEGQYPGQFGNAAKATAQAQEAAEKAKALADQMKATGTATTDLTASLAKTPDAANSATTSLTGLISKLASGLGGSFGIGSALAATGFAGGGHVRGPGSGTSDSIPAMLSHGEFVVNAKSTSRHRSLLEAVNSGKAPRFATGGFVGDTFASSSTYSPITTINLTGSGNPQQDARLADQVGRAVQAAQPAPDRFRRTSQQKLAGAHQSMARAGSKNN